jgi:hypothetical protein
MIRLAQLTNKASRRVALVEEPRLRLLDKLSSVYALAQEVFANRTSMTKLIQQSSARETLDYDAVYRGESDWKLMPPIDHPDELARCLVSGTGLTHLGSAKNRSAMHGASDAELTDSMKMFRWGVEGGRPAPGKIGVVPEWFYKGNGSILRAHNQPLLTPSFAEDGGEEGEIAGVYLIGPDGKPCRVGMAIGNEFSDHRFEKKNYLNLAGSKIRTCSLGPELVIDPEFNSVPGKVDPEFNSVPGKVSIERNGKIIWSKEICSGEAEMCHSLQNIEHHHFKFETHRRPGDVHVHYFGACALSFGDGLQLADGDVMEIQFDGFGRPLRNPVRVVESANNLVSVSSLA